jgi:hypothetical protein
VLPLSNSPSSSWLSCTAAGGSLTDAGGYTAVTDVLQDLRPSPLPGYEVRFETPPGDQAQVDFAQFQVIFTDEPTVTRIVYLTHQIRTGREKQLFFEVPLCLSGRCGHLGGAPPTVASSQPLEGL